MPIQEVVDFSRCAKGCIAECKLRSEPITSKVVDGIIATAIAVGCQDKGALFAEISCELHEGRPVHPLVVFADQNPGTTLIISP